MRTAIFDLDGTLADTSADLIAAANACFETPMLDPIADQATAFKGARAMLRLGFSRLDDSAIDTQVEAKFPLLLKYYEENIDTHTRVYEGVTQCLEQLLKDNWCLGVCTNKPEKLAETLLQRLNIRDYFSAMLGADTLPVRKPDPTHLFETIKRAGGNSARAVLIGDTTTDRETAKAASIPCILVTFGPDGNSVTKMTPEGLLDHYDDLPRLLDQIVP